MRFTQTRSSISSWLTLANQVTCTHNFAFRENISINLRSSVSCLVLDPVTLIYTAWHMHANADMHPDVFDCSNATDENLESVGWKTFCQPTRSCYCYSRTVCFALSAWYIICMYARHTPEVCASDPTLTSHTTNTLHNSVPQSGPLSDNYASFEIHVDCSNMGLSQIPLGLPPDTNALCEPETKRP